MARCPLVRLGSAQAVCRPRQCPGSRRRRRESVAVISTRLIPLIEGHVEELTRAVGPF